MDRLIASKKANLFRLAELLALRDQAIPFELSKTVNHKLERIWRLAHYRPQPSKTAKSSSA